MKLYADTHTHTVASTHAYSTIMENARAAADRGLKILAITDHAPAIEDSPHKLHFMGYHALEKTLFGVQMLYGAELNILDYDGNIPVDYEELVLEAKWAKILLEVNNASLKNAFYRTNARENIITMLKLCEKHGAMVSVGTDAHAAGAVGDMDNAIALMEEIGFPEELVINTSHEALIKHLANVPFPFFSRGKSLISWSRYFSA